MNYYPFHLGDYASHTGHLDPMEDLAYRRMLDAYYLREGQLPADVAEIARLVRLRDHAATVRDVLNEFFEQTPEGWRHVRCDEEILRMQDKQAKARASAHASVNARKAKAQQPHSESTANVERTLSERSTDVQLPTPTPTPTPVIDAAPKGAAKAKRLSADWMLPKDWGLWALENMRWDEATIRLEADKFRDFWVAKAGKDACKNDWLATWRNWCRNSRSEPKAVVSSFAGGI